MSLSHCAFEAICVINSTSAHCFPMQPTDLIKAAAEPTYENGELHHGGSDLDLKGSLPYYAVEVIYCLALLQLLTAVLSDKFWWLLLAVRLTAADHYFM